ncbi:MAG: GNAT family N-acetyltransferase [Candidatus Omnitrophica bacterium]|nr:GNAT family N-acetyltransferase [Candidatus Omnitrophota bacterium]
MSQEFKANIRKFESRDKDAVRQIAYATAFMGEPAAVFFDGADIVSAALTAYFTDYEPQSCFVAEVDAQVVGFLSGARNKVELERVSNNKIFLDLFWRALKSGILLRSKNINFIWRCLWDMLKGRLVAPDFSQEYPAILHINIRKEFRGSNIGSGLISSYLSYLKDEGVKGVHLATMSDKAANFFSRQGFKLLYTSRRSYFRHILHRDVPLYIYGMKLAG